MMNEKRQTEALFKQVALRGVYVAHIKRDRYIKKPFYEVADQHPL